MLPPAAEQPKLERVLGQLTASVEELLLGGLTTASETTRQTVTAAMQEAARFRLLRLGSALRATADELGRFAKQDAAFSRRRLTFFLNRSWLLGRGLVHALKTRSEAEFDRLNWTPPTRPLASLEAVCVGVVKRVTSAAVLFDFRLRAVAEVSPITTGQRLTWSVIFPVKPGVAVPAEGYLHLPQKQKFTPTLFLEKKVVAFKNVTVSLDPAAGARVTLTEASTVATGPAFAKWEPFLEWTLAPSIERLTSHTPGPLDLDKELQEEVILRDYDIRPAEEGDEPGQSEYPVTAAGLELRAIVGADPEGKALRKAMESLRKLKKEKPPLLGLMHYERCRLVLQPLASFGKDGPEYLTISKENIDKAALLKALKFT